MKIISIPISQIKSTGEYRGTEQELATLIDSMRSLKQLQPIVLNSRYEVIFGRRRIASAKHLGWKEIWAVVDPTFDDVIKAARAERDENCPGCRVPLTRKEQLEMARRLEELENPEAAKRKAASQAKKGEKVGERKVTENLPSPSEKGSVRDKVAEAVGMSGRTLEKAQAVIDAAQREPERYLDLAEQVSEDNQPIDPVYQEFRKRHEIYDAADKDARFATVAEKLTEQHDTDAAHEQYERLRDEQSKDKAGNLLPKKLVKVFNDPWISQCVANLDTALALIKQVNREIGKHRTWPHIQPGVSSMGDEAVTCIESVREGLEEAIPHAVCGCGGDGCKKCKGAGWVPKT